MEIHLPPDLEEYLKQKTSAGEDLTPGMVIAEGLYLLRDQDWLNRVKVEKLKKEIQKGIDQADRGELAPLEIEAIKASGRKRLAKRLVAK
jgi:antitoxin ParD1/3/4